MGRIEKTVFISYRRTNAAWALLIYKDLTSHGYDAFIDFDGIASGDFSQIIVENIHSRAHFIVLLTPSALDRCSQPGDWLRREIETAIQAKRNIIPLTFEDFKFSSPAIAAQLTGTLAPLRSYQALTVPTGYFDDAMKQLRHKFLNVALDTVLHPASTVAQQAAQEQQAAATAAPAVEKKNLSAQVSYERAFAETDPQKKIQLYSEFLEFQPNNGDAYYNRGLARAGQSDYQGAIEDYTQATRLNTSDPDPWHSRGNARYERGDLTGAIDDYNRAIRMKPGAAILYVSRGIARYDNGDTKGAMDDYARAIEIDPAYADTYNARGYALYSEGNNEAAIADYTKAIELNPGYAEAFSRRAYSRFQNKDYQGTIDDYSKTIDLQPDLALPYYYRGYSRMELQQYQPALDDFQKYLKLGGDARSQTEQYIRDLKTKLST